MNKHLIFYDFLLLYFSFALIVRSFLFFYFLGAQLQVSDEIFSQRGTIDELTERGENMSLPPFQNAELLL